MRRKNITNVIIRESITQALLLLMQKQPFSDIRITDIVEKAGVSRVSFYRNYKNREEVLVSYLDEAAREWWSECKTKGGNPISGVFEHCLDIRDVLELMYRHGLYHLLWQDLYNLLGPTANEDKQLAYKKSELIGCIFGVLIEWIGRGMIETPEEMKNIFDTQQANLLIHEAG